MHHALDLVYRTCIWVAGVAIVGMACIVPVGVFMRYVMGVGAQWPEPIAILLMVVFTFIGAAAAYRAGGHIAVTILTDRLPATARRMADRLVGLLMLVVCGFVVLYGLRLCIDTMGQSISELPWMPVGVTYLPIPIGATLTIVFVLEHLVAGSQHRRQAVSMGDAG